MYAFQLLLSVDPSLGRVDYSLLSDQTLLEMLIDGFDDASKQPYQDNDGMYQDVCTWCCVTCDDDDRVIEVDIDSTSVGGSLELCYIPPKVKELYVTTMYGNRLTGSVDLTHLPGGMHDLSLSKNRLNGEIDLTCLPNRTTYLYLDNNQFTGEIDLTQLPDGMKELFLNNNQLSGSLVLSKLPPAMRCMNVRGNNFHAVAVVASEARGHIMLRGSGVTSVMDEKGRKLESKRFFE